MKYEHLIEINDPALLTLAPLSRSDIWQGLMLRVEQPTLFLPHLEQMNVLARDDSGLVRELDFGNLRIRDRVLVQLLDSVSIEVIAPAEHAGSLLQITIEEPQPQRLFLRFSYSTTLQDAPGTPDADLSSYVKSAYRESDIESVKIMREQLARKPIN
ncbi:MAG: hypothetical protein QG667_2344 [Pseudomonadota bacterium]|jgi:hypothetical protein|nr:hypothetical protein [Pseudomonadota bacterium]